MLKHCIIIYYLYYDCIVNAFLFLDTNTISDIEIIQSLLYCFQGVDSNWIIFNQNEKQFIVTAKVLKFFQILKQIYYCIYFMLYTINFYFC